MSGQEESAAEAEPQAESTDFTVAAGETPAASETASEAETEPTPYCAVCQRSFPHVRGLEQHLKQSSQHPHCCVECRLDYVSDRSLHVCICVCSRILRHAWLNN